MSLHKIERMPSFGIAMPINRPFGRWSVLISFSDGNAPILIDAEEAYLYRPSHVAKKFHYGKHKSEPFDSYY